MEELNVELVSVQTSIVIGPIEGVISFVRMTILADINLLF